MNRRALWVGAFVLVLAVWLARGNRPSPEPIQVAKTEIAPTARTQTLPSIEIRALPTAELPYPSSSSTVANGRSDSIRIQVLDDQTVVAFGDIQLGLLPPEHQDDFADGRALQVQAVEPGLWPTQNHVATIPFLISPELAAKHPELKRRIHSALEIFKSQTPVQWTPLTDETDGIVFEALPEAQSKLCLSYLGKHRGIQPIRLGSQCGQQEILHEIMHALGFIHEHTRPERDQFVDILWAQIPKAFQAQFEKAPEAWLTPLRIAGDAGRFDPQSVMMYRLDTFGQPEQPTMRWIAPTQYTAPVQNGLSALDLARLHALYSR